jgi:quinol monooxygenase YgiN
MYVVIVEFSVKPGLAVSFIERVRQQARDSFDGEPDCHVFDVCTDPDRANFVLLYEVYSDRSAFAAHLASAHFSDFDATVRDWIVDKRLACFERIEATG